MMTHSWQVDGGGGDWRWSENWWWWWWWRCVSLFWSGKWKEEAKGWCAFSFYWFSQLLVFLFYFNWIFFL